MDMSEVKTQRRAVVSIDSSILFFGLLNACLDQSAIDRGLRLILRGPQFMKEGVKTFLETQGINISGFMQNEPSTPVSQAEVREFVEPFLRKAADMTTLAQIADTYLFQKDTTPENVVYAFYIGARYVIVRDRQPTKAESKRIWEIALWIAQNSKIGSPHWDELRKQGDVHLSDWLDVMKENARKRFETFLNQKKRAEEASNKAVESLLKSVFDVPTSQNSASC